MKIHNDKRKLHGVPRLTWSVDLTKDAENWALKLAKDDAGISHENSEKYGENISGSYGKISWLIEIYTFSKYQTMFYYVSCPLYHL